MSGQLGLEKFCKGDGNVGLKGLSTSACFYRTRGVIFEIATNYAPWTRTRCIHELIDIDQRLEYCVPLEADLGETWLTLLECISF